MIMLLSSGFSIGDILEYGLLYLNQVKGAAYFVISVILICAAGYLLGGINTAIIVSTKMYGKDIRKSGSGNAGMTNMLRTYGKKAAILTIVGDMAKTALACLIGALVLGQNGAFLGGLAAAVGHMWPVWFRFKGGKGVLSLATVMLCCSPKVFLICFTVFFIIVAFTKYISLGSVVCALLLPIVQSRFSGSWNLYMIPLIIVCIIIVWQHRTNIRRLREGNENKIHLGKNGEHLPVWILAVISVVLAAASVLSVVLTFRTEYAVSYKKDRMTSAELRIIFINEKTEYFGQNEHNEDHDGEIMDAAIMKAKRILAVREAAEADGRSVTAAGEKAAYSFFDDLTKLYGYRENDTAETYCHRIYGQDISPDKVREVKIALIFAEEYEAAVTHEKMEEMLDAAEKDMKVSEKIRAAVIDKY